MCLVISIAAIVGVSCSDVVPPRPEPMATAEPIAVPKSNAAVTVTAQDPGLPIFNASYGTYCVTSPLADCGRPNFTAKGPNFAKKTAVQLTIGGSLNATPKSQYPTPGWSGPVFTGSVPPQGALWSNTCIGQLSISSNGDSGWFPCNGGNPRQFILAQGDINISRAWRYGEICSAPNNGRVYCETLSGAHTLRIERVPAVLSATASETTILQGDSITFSWKVTPEYIDQAGWSRLTIPVELSGWTYTMPGVATPLFCNYKTCKLKPTASGVLKIGGHVNGTAQSIDIPIKVLKDSLIVRGSQLVTRGSRGSWTASTARGTNFSVSGWQWAADSGIARTNVTECTTNKSCAADVFEAGTITVSGTIDGVGASSASLKVAVKSQIRLTANPTSTLVGSTSKFTFTVDGKVEKPGAWRWAGPDPSEAATCGAEIECIQQMRNPGVGTMTAYLSSDMTGDSASASVSIGLDCSTVLPPSGLVAPRRGVGAGVTARTTLSGSSSMMRATEACRRIDPDTGTAPPPPGPEPAPPPPPPSDSAYYRLKVVQYVGVAGGPRSGIGPPTIDDSVHFALVYPRNASVAFDYAAAPRYTDLVLLVDSVRTMAFKGTLQMTRDRVIHVGAAFDYSNDPIITSYRQRWRALLQTATDAGKVEAFRQHLSWYISQVAAQPAGSDSLDRKLNIAFILEVDLTRDQSLLREFDRALKGHVFSTPPGAPANQLEVLRPQDYRDTPTVYARRMAGQPGRTEVIFINGIFNTLDGVTGDHGPFDALKRIVDNNPLFPQSKADYFYNRNLEAQFTADGGFKCEATHKRTRQLFSKIVRWAAWATCKGAQIGLRFREWDPIEAVRQVVELQHGIDINDSRPLDADSLTAKLARYYHGALGAHTIFVTHSQGNLILAQALQQIEALEQRPLQQGPCTAHASLASPVEKSRFNPRLTSFQRGMIMNNDILLVLGAKNDFSRGNSAVSRQAQAAIDSTNVLLKLIPKVTWGFKAHEVMPNYFREPENHQTLTGWLTDLHTACQDLP